MVFEAVAATTAIAATLIVVAVLSSQRYGIRLES